MRQVPGVAFYERDCTYLLRSVTLIVTLAEEEKCVR
jgi:hypothetical protein